MPWRSWSLADWNRVLLRHFFFVRPDGDAGPVSQLVVTAEEFARAAGVDDQRGTEARDAFLGMMQSKLLSSGTLLGRDARELAANWSERQANAPPFVVHLLLTCLIASDVSDERAAEGNFRRRLDQLFGRQHSNHALDELPPLWSRLANWLATESQRRSGSRELVLPDVGHYRIIGIPLRLSFPSRRDELLLVRLLNEAELLGEEPPVRAVLRLIESHVPIFGERFQKAFHDFRRRYDTRDPSINRSPFWSAVRAATLTGARSQSSATGRATLFMEADLEDAGHFRLLLLLDDTSATRLPRPFTAVPLEEPMRDCGYVLGVQTSAPENPIDVDEAARRLLAAVRPQFPPAFSWSHIAAAVREGVLLFARDDDGSHYLATRLPEGGSAVDMLVRTDLAGRLVRLLDAVGVQRNDLRSKYGGWRELRAVEAADLNRLDYSSSERLAGIRCLQPTLAPTVPHVSGGIRLDRGAWLGTRGFLPSVHAPTAQAVTLRRRHAEAEGGSVPLVQDRLSSGWSFSESAAPLDGEYDLCVDWPEGFSSTTLSFRDVVRDGDYLEAYAARWMTEGSASDTVDVDDSGSIALSGIMQASPPVWQVPSRQPVSEAFERACEDRDRVERLSTAIAALSLRRRGLPEAFLFDLFAKVFGAARPLLWDILRSWVEMGVLSRLVSHSWRHAAYFGLSPRIVAHCAPAGIRAALLGLVAPGLRHEVVGAAAHVGVFTELEWRAASAFTPPVLRLHAARTGDLESVASRAGLKGVAWVRPPEEVLRRLAAVIDDVRRAEPPKNYDVYGHWSWDALRFHHGPAPVGEAVALEWMRRRDAPDYYVVRSGDNVSWWGRSRVWAIHAIARRCRRRIAVEREGTNLDCARPGEPYLPVGIARLAVALGAPPPGQLPSGVGYRYALPSTWLCRLVSSSLWPEISAKAPVLLSRLHWLELATRERAGGRATSIPPGVRTALLAIDAPEAIRLANAGRIPVALLPLLLDIVRRTRAAAIHEG